MVNTRKSSIGLKAEVGETTNKEDSFSTSFNLSSFKKRVNKLSENQEKAIKETGFGHLLMIPSHRLSKNLLAELMEKWCPDSCAFIIVPIGMSYGSSISSIKLKITLTDVALVLGLPVTGDRVILREDEPFSGLEEEYGATPENRWLTAASIEKKLDSLGEAVNDDFVRLFLLFTFAKLLFPGADSKIDSRYISLVQDLDKVHTFAWGEAVLKNITDWLCKRKVKSEQFIGGCLFFLQIWSYEHIDVARPKLINDDTIFPRACRWENNKPQPRKWFRARFEGLIKDQVVTKLRLSPHESTIDLFNAIDKDMLDENQTRLNIMDQWIDEKTQEPDQIVVREVQRTKGECLDQLTGETELQSTSKDECLSVAVVSDDDEQEENIANREQALLEENSELKKEINSLREENKTMKDQFKEDNAELRNLREENKVLKDQLQEQNAKLDSLRKENQLASSSEGLIELEIIREYEQQYGIQL